MSGGGVKALPRQPEVNPQELKAQEGIERKAGLNRLSVATDRCPEQSPEVEVGGTGSGGATRREKKLTNAMRARLVDEASRLGSGENP
jgi:hypothetical protein